MDCFMEVPEPCPDRFAAALRGLGRAWGLGFRLEGLGFRIEGVVFRV